jgi:hypothetical protein
MKEFAKFGTAVKTLRVQLQETPGELCASLEIDVELLTLIESGDIQPSEDIVDQLVSHFQLSDTDAHNFWKLAGYDETPEDKDKPQAIFVPFNELKISYTDLVHVAVSNHGVVLNFMQGSTPGLPPMVVARLGMSKEHAMSVMEVMANALKKSIEQEKESISKKNQKPLELGSGE